MSTADGSVIGVTKIVDHGPDASRWNLVILGDGYQSAELATYASDALNFANTLAATAPFNTVWSAVNVHRVDVSSTDSGADDPAGACGGTGATAHTYFDATFCHGGQIRRLLSVDNTSALNVARAQVPQMTMTLVIVNSAIYGGSGGPVAVFSKAAGAEQIGIHEMAHTAFGLADEYSTYAGCSSGETGHDTYTGAEPTEANVTANTDRNTLKWGALVAAATALPTTVNANCAQCDTQASPVPAGTVGTFVGARYFHCGLYRPEYDCEMRTLGQPFCAVCRGVISDTLTPFLPGPPVIDSFSPTSGDPAGGTIVVLTGQGFFSASAVNFGATPAVTFNVDSDTQITALSPPGTGSVNLTVATPAGNSASTLATQFSYVAPASMPQVTSIAPATGSTSGGDAVTMTGSGFTGAAAVKFGALDASAFNVDTDTQITATSPASGAGTVDITVSTGAGTSAASAADRFTFAVPAPAVTAVAPASGVAAGGTSVIITGTAFNSASAVTFGTTPATGYSVDSDTQITATSPAGTGTVDVRVTTPSGTSAVVAGDQFGYQVPGAPAVTGINPSGGSAAGGDAVTITGTGFTGATGVQFGTAAATGVAVNSDTQVTAVSPAGSGTVDVTVTTPAGTSPTGAADQFTYGPPAVPVVTSVNPNNGAGAGGDVVTIAGSGFVGASAVAFGVNAAQSFSVDSDTQITATSPTGGGTVDVTVTTPGGASATGAADRFSYTTLGLPSVTGVSPNTGSIAGGDTVVITGIGFTNASDVSFGGATALFSVDMDTQITATSPAANASGNVDITVTTPAGTSANNASDTFTYF
ncbi:IPT/TIG domain-containing protein [Ralstonia pseudosolanacearum]|uniref:IPT/TIG domain-containing protein n=1 Tax=Ralstonia pseudosolanacearum TaxID=1310165 RepID=UPI001FFAA4C2|nr:IPT/TIG domain-containing protein [Ralstonia pseudosolanacearum]